MGPWIAPAVSGFAAYLQTGLSRFWMTASKGSLAFARGSLCLHHGYSRPIVAPAVSRARGVSANRTLAVLGWLRPGALGASARKNVRTSSLPVLQTLSLLLMTRFGLCSCGVNHEFALLLHEVSCRSASWSLMVFDIKIQSILIRTMSQLLVQMGPWFAPAVFMVRGLSADRTLAVLG